MAQLRGSVGRPFGADGHAAGARVREATAPTLEETSVASARHVHALDEELPAEVGYNQQRLRKPRGKIGPESSTDEGGPARATTFFPGGLFKQVTMSWAQQRQAIKLAAEAGVRARTSAAGSETLPLTHHHLRYAMLSRPNGELTRAGQYYYQLIGQPPPAGSTTATNPSSARGPTITSCSAAKKLLRSLQPNGNYPVDQAREALLQGQVGGLGGARARHHPGRAAKRPEPRHALRAHQAPARHGPQRRPVPAEQRALGRVE